MASTPSELNELTDAELRSHVQNVLNALQDSAAPAVQRVAKFITAEIMRRLHGFVIEARRNGHACGGWPRQATLARVVGCFTGVTVSRSDAEYIGNAEDTFMRDYVKQLTKAQQAQSRARSRAQRAGRVVQADIDDNRVSVLKSKLCVCKYGGVPRGVLVPHNAPAYPIHNLPVPVRKVEYADERNVQLQEEIIKLKREQQEREMQFNLHALCTAVEKEREARKLAEKEVVDAENARAEAALQAASRVQEMKRCLRNAESECLNAKAHVERLGYQLVFPTMLWGLVRNF